MLSRRRGLCGKKFTKSFANPVYSAFETAGIENLHATHYASFCHLDIPRRVNYWPPLAIPCFDKG